MADPRDLGQDLETLLSADADGPAGRIEALHAERMIAGVLDAVHAPRAITQAPAAKSRRGAWLLLAALVITGTAAAMYTVQRGKEEQVAEHALAARAQKPEAAPLPSVNAPVAAPTPSVQPESVKPAQPAVAVVETRAPSARSVEDLLERANHLRGTGDYRAAERAYTAVIAQRASGPAAYTARVAAAELRLEQLSDAKGALRAFAEALRSNPNGALSPEIHEGMAQAYRVLGRSRDERDALRALLAKAASGPAAERARARLQVLDAAP